MWIKKLKIIFLLFLMAGLLPHIVMAANNYPLTEALFQEVLKNEAMLKKNPDSNKAKFECAMSYAYTGLIEEGWETLKTVPKSYADEVISSYSEKIKEEPNQWRHYFKIAFGYYFKEDRKTAIENFEHVLKIEENQVWAMGFIALIKGETDQLDEAESLCKKGLSIQSDAAGLHFLLAECYRRKKKYFKCFNQLLKCNHYRNILKRKVKEMRND